MIRQPFWRYRPGRASDGAGGSVDLLPEESEIIVFYGVSQLHQKSPSVTGVDASEDVRVGDIIEFAGDD